METSVAIPLFRGFYGLDGVVFGEIHMDEDVVGNWGFLVIEGLKGGRVGLAC